MLPLDLLVKPEAIASVEFFSTHFAEMFCRSLKTFENHIP